MHEPVGGDRGGHRAAVDEAEVARARGGDQRSGPEDVANASLGARIEADPAAARWRIAHIFRSDPERPELRAPLARPDLGLNDGDGILGLGPQASIDQLRNAFAASSHAR